MVTIPQLGWLVLAFGIVACGLALWRRRPLRGCAADLGLAFALVWAVLLLAAWSFSSSSGEAFEVSESSARFWRNAGGTLVVLAPWIGALGLSRLRGRRFWHTVVLGLLSLGPLAVWLVLYLKGPAGGWSVSEALRLTAMAAAICALALCAGSWSRKSRSRPPAESSGSSSLVSKGRGSIGSGSVARVVAGFAMIGAALYLVGCAPSGELRLSLVDAESGAPTPARIELIDSAGAAVVPNEALPIVSDCGMLPLHNWYPALGRLQAAWRRTTRIHDPYRKTDQFYVDGAMTTDLAPGRYSLRIRRGPETRVETREVEITRGGETAIEIPLERWIDLPARGWYSADDHLHFPRPSDVLDADLAAWMEAEDLWVANLLQMGLAQDVHITPQFGFGSPSVYRGRRGILVGGQENPRTHILGHSILLGARRWIDQPDRYALYDEVWRESHRHGGVNGYAHFALAAAEKGLALWGQEGLIDFIEVQNFGFPFYERWYESLNLGLPMVPTAGSDFPCVANLPGRDRFYTKIDGEFTYEAWLDGVRQGRTMVSNGPFVELDVDGVDVGARLTLEEGRQVRIEGQVVFDPTVDRVTRLELIDAGEVVHVVEAVGPDQARRTDLEAATQSEGTLTLTLDYPIEETTWLALRAFGTKVDEVRPGSLDLLKTALRAPPSPSADGVIDQIDSILGDGSAPVAAAHTAAIFVDVAGSPALVARPGARAAAALWLQRLDEFEAWISDDQIPDLAGFPGRGDGLSLEDLTAHRDELREELATARAWLERIAAGEPVRQD